uniref:Si:ch211-188c16.1 n=1 Tax=Seriola lalandi dorsalis TaxID=1841481 RepID=A0A3B4WVH2_SERLL
MIYFFMEAPINFKALRAKFQEEALLAQCKAGRPAVAEKPKLLPPPGGHCSSVVSNISIAVENKTPVPPRVIFRDGLRASGGKRPISFPPQLQQTSPLSQPANGDSTTRQSLKVRHMPLVLPVQPHKLEPEPVKEILPQTKIKKKGLLLPFKSAKASKVSGENGEEPTYADLTTRPSSAPGEMPSVEKQTTEDGVLLQSDQSTAECPLSSPDIPITPPPAETSVDSDSRIISTLERAKKKFSRRQMLISTKHKSLRSPDCNSKDKAFPSPPKNTDSVGSDLPVPPPVCLPHLALVQFVFSKERQSPNTADFKEQKKREKQRLEKEKKEQKEREKKENEMKKKFKVTGDEEPMYHAKVMVASKVRKNDLPVKSGDTVSIIRTTNCPKGKWLARDVNHKYGYISVMNVELNIKEMLELGKKAQAAGRGGNLEGDTISIGSSLVLLDLYLYQQSTVRVCQRSTSGALPDVYKRHEQEVDFTELEFLPPPPLYADTY